MCPSCISGIKVIAFADSAGLVELGRTIADDNGGFADLDLGREDQKRVWITAEDEAGRRSDLVLMRDVVLTVTVGSDAQSPHHFRETRWQEPSLINWDLRRPDQLEVLAAVGGPRITTLGASGWRRVALGGATLGNRLGHVMAYDSARDRAVLFGGFALAHPMLNCPDYGCVSRNFWEWDSSSWGPVTVGGYPPSDSAYHAMAFDKANGTTVIFGGWTNFNDPGVGPSQP